ncbi:MULTISPECIES: ornithine cyclodeaminase family protein [unclassified Mesorhizobium]|uniref:ornithine cyclodeaminase family protein n=1 Tax=unclassified Mesorhizobium TaxID=325217 RepID=UPI000FCBF237|nr:MULTISPECIES: ornithine cyclodeaminase family protein [unclassified Mesorhizobium]RUU67309.1 ornithine cyclodeaminase family protein [Mesorhizobium sp. M7A.T.Ca.TU.009.01.1.1]RUW99828.1 ornithine cyclodeaminase family protein [Mesorhizobium sp. M8A.F.Ca.ET.023.01.1.1]RVD50404.1 ornithine cyclodeaminase family protein [Mesorhizobium sp. M8A.F.Ca.ET.023.02.2.1]TGR36818.1 ornithine cyclodeaminase family protein [bacterium M00.F.Ca.ET.199.01.1.1]TGU17581.1 ornithine cyclodeaminase family protei
MNDQLLYLSGAEIAALRPNPADLRLSLARAFRLHAQHRVQVRPKQTLAIAPGHFFQAMCAASPEPPYAAAKWVGIAENSGRGLSNVNGLVILSDFNTGRPLAIMDGNSLTVLRTAAMSALAAEYLARPDSTSIGFVGCGQQALGHLEAMYDLFPGLAEAVCFDRNATSARRLAVIAREKGLQSRETTAADDALACDIVITTVPGTTTLTPFLDASLLRPGSFVSAVDLGRSWRVETFNVFDLRVVDDRAQAEDPENRSKLAYPGPFDSDLAMLASGVERGRSSDPSQRTLFLFPGFALADLAVASAVFETALRTGGGVGLQR